jgi:hypothetical protein
MTATFEALGLGHLSGPEKRFLMFRLEDDLYRLHGVISKEEVLNEMEYRSKRSQEHPEDSIDGEVFFAQVEKEFPE